MSLADKFNLLNEYNVLRLVCALFFIPHIIGKFRVPQTLAFYARVGFRPAKFWMYLAAAIEIVVIIALVLDWHTAVFASIAFIHLTVAAIATWKDTGRWIWVTGGIEYCAFWALCCLVLAMHAYRTAGI